jgi:hypothetical protein
VVATPATCTPPQPVAEDYLAYVKEEPLQPHACESGREVYRFVGYTFHLGTEVDMLRIDVSTDGHAMLTVRRTDYAIAGTPSLIFDKSRALTDAEVAEFRKAFDASDAHRAGTHAVLRTERCKRSGSYPRPAISQERSLLRR